MIDNIAPKVLCGQCASIATIILPLQGLEEYSNMVVINVRNLLNARNE